jgi:hypothetical protein
VLTALAGGCAAGVVLGAVYALVNHHDPVIYLNVFLVLAAAWALGTAAAQGVRLGHIRNRAAGAFIGAVVFVAAYVSHWCVFLSTVIVNYSADVESFDIKAILELAAEFARNPGDTLRLIVRFNEAGTWSISGGGSSAVPVNGIVLALIWLAEAVILCYSSVRKPWIEAGKPYSERRSKWLDQKELPRHVELIENSEEFLNALARNDFSALTKPLDETGKKYLRYASVTLYTDSFDPYLSVQNVYSAGHKPTKQATLGKRIWGRFFSPQEEGSTASILVQYLKINTSISQSITEVLGKKPATLKRAVPKTGK